MSKFFQLLAASVVASSTVAANAVDRVEVPVVFDGDRVVIQASVGSSGPLTLGIDTGAGGIRIWQEHLKLSELKRTGKRDKVMYGSGKTGLDGEVVKGSVKIGTFELPGKTELQLITGHICKEGSGKNCGEHGSRRNYAGTLGLRPMHPVDASKKDKVNNPLIVEGPFRYILRVPRNDTEQGALIINPTNKEMAAFKRIQLTAGNNARFPICINSFCYETILDTGNDSNQIPAESKKELKALNLPVDNDKVTAGTQIGFVIGKGANSFSGQLTAGKGAAAIHLREGKGHGVLGINFFRYFDVLYDFKDASIGLALKKASSVKSVGEFWLGKLAKHVIQGEFSDFEGSKPVGFSHGHFDLVVEALDNAAGELLFGPKVVED